MDFRKSEQARSLRQDPITGQSQFQATSETAPFDGGDDDGIELVDSPEAVMKCGKQRWHLIWSVLRNVGSAAKLLVGPADDHDAGDVIVADQL
jgi:hypothetical protein